MDERTAFEIGQRIEANRATAFRYVIPLTDPIPYDVTIEEYDRHVTLMRWAKMVVSADEDEYVEYPEGFTTEELDAALHLVMYHPSRQPMPVPLVRSGQGRTADDTAEKTVENWTLLIVLFALFCFFVGCCFSA